MFTHNQHTGISRHDHRNKPFYKLAICNDPTTKAKVFAAETHQSIYHFYNLTEREEQQINQAIKLYTTYEGWNSAEKIVIDFLESRYSLGGKDVEQIDALVKTNTYYKGKLEHFVCLQKPMSDSKAKNLSPEKRKKLTQQFRKAENLQEGYACDALFNGLDSSQLYNQSPSQPKVEEIKEEEPQPFAKSNQRNKGGLFSWDSERGFILGKTPDPVVTPLATQDDTLSQLLSNIRKPT